MAGGTFTPHPPPCSFCGGRLSYEIEGLTMAQLKEKIQEVTRRRRARHKEALQSAGLNY